MDYKSATISCIERITDEVVLKKLYTIVKKADKKSRCAPKERVDRDAIMDDISDEICIAVRNRLAR